MLMELTRRMLQPCLRAWRIDGLALLEHRARSFFLLSRERPLELEPTLSKLCRMALHFMEQSSEKYISSAIWLLTEDAHQSPALRKLVLAFEAEEGIGRDSILIASPKRILPRVADRSRIFQSNH